MRQKVDFVVRVCYNVGINICKEKRKLKKIFAVFFTLMFIICICSSAILPTAAINESNTRGVTFSATLDKAKFVPSDDEQTVVLTFVADSPITLDGIGFKVVCDAPIEIKAIEGNGVNISFFGADANPATGIVGWSTPDAENLNGVTTISRITFCIPENVKAGEYAVGITQIEVTSDYGRIWEKSASAMAVITVGNQPSSEDTTAEPEDTTAEPEDTTAEPEDTTAKPEDTTAEPEDTTTKPEDTTAEPDDAPTDPDDSEPLPFADVTKADWFYSSVKYAYTNKIMQGTGASEFAPNVSTSRAMLVTMLWRLENSPSLVRTNKFADVLDSAWYAGAVEWAYKNELVLGYSETTFAPDAPITREQMVSILWRYAKYKGFDVSVHGPIPFGDYTDINSVNSYALAPMGWALHTKLIQGVDATTLAPGQTASRAQVATVLMRFIENIK